MTEEAGDHPQGQKRHPAFENWGTKIKTRKCSLEILQNKRSNWKNNSPNPVLISGYPLCELLSWSAAPRQHLPLALGFHELGRNLMSESRTTWPPDRPLIKRKTNQSPSSPKPANASSPRPSEH